MKKILSYIICVSITLNIFIPAFADDTIDINQMVSDTSFYIYNNVKNPHVGSIGGEWAVLGLARSNEEIPDEYYDNYYKAVEEYVKEREGNLHDKKYTEYSRLIVALTAIGKNPADVAGYNLFTPLGDYEKTVWQGLNGPIWALISLDSGNYDMPVNPDAKIQATREMYIQRILDCQLADGGWSLLGGTTAATSSDSASDPDITGMALQALSKYRDDERVQGAIDTALNTMSEKQDDKGGFSSWGTENSESCVQLLVALCELGIPYTDSRFVKNGYTILDHLLCYYNNDSSGFSHIPDGETNLMATEQALYCLVAIKRMSEGQNSLYRMSDAITVTKNKDDFEGLKNKNPDIQKKSVVNPDKTFTDIQGHLNQIPIECLASRNIINGKTSDIFEPDSTMTRAEFATIIARGLGLPVKGNVCFTDVTADNWFYNYVSTAYSYGIIKGISETEFNPNGIITREEAAVMVARAASLCGMDAEVETFEARNILAGFLDYVKASDWSISSLAFCYGEGILSDRVLEIKPKEPVTRAEIAEMLYNLLKLSELL